MKINTLQTNKLYLIVFWFLLLLFNASAINSAQLFIDYLEGNVKYSSKNSTEWKTVTPNTILKYNHEIMTEDNGYISIELEDSSLISVNENSRITIEQQQISDTIQERLAGLYFGTIKVNLKKQKNNKFSVRTPQTVVGVRGTEFTVGYEDENEAEISVEQGKISVGLLGENNNIIKDQFLTANHSMKVNEKKKIINKIKGQLENHKNIWQHFKNKKELFKNRRIKKRLEKNIIFLKNRIRKTNNSKAKLFLKNKLNKLTYEYKKINSKQNELSKKLKINSEKYLKYKKSIQKRKAAFIKKLKSRKNIRSYIKKKKLENKKARTERQKIIKSKIKKRVQENRQNRRNRRNRRNKRNR